MLNCNCKHNEANGGSENYGAQGKPHVDYSFSDLNEAWLVASAGSDFGSTTIASALVW
jgi:hypothetical protein